MTTEGWHHHWKARSEKDECRRFGVPQLIVPEHDMRKRAGFNIEDHITLALYTSEDLASILRRHMQTLQSETLADNLSIVVDQPAASLPDEVYREKISPQELKKLENYTVEVVLGRL
jgi:isoleucyl-tRNA synthetase